MRAVYGTRGTNKRPAELPVEAVYVATCCEYDKAGVIADCAVAAGAIREYSLSKTS